MIRIKWDIEEAVALYNLFTECGFPIPQSRLEKLSEIYNKRAKILGINIDDKFRNVAGLHMQSSCLEYISSQGKRGLSSGSKLFYRVDDLYKNEREKFESILDNFIRKYGVF